MSNNNSIHPPQRLQYHDENSNHVMLYGLSRTKCGYCQGSRTNILSIANPQTEEFRRHQQQQQKREPCPIIFSSVVDNDSNGGSNDGMNRNGSNNNSSNKDEEKVTSSTSSKAYSIGASSFTADDYQILVNRGWRRSGDLLYVPKNWECCCPSHPIRLNVNRFQPGKSHKKVMKFMNAALLAGVSTDSNDAGSNGSNDSSEKKHNGNGGIDVQRGPGAAHVSQGRKRPRRNTKQSKIANDDYTKPNQKQLEQYAQECVFEKSDIPTLLKRETIQSVQKYVRQLQPQNDVEMNHKLHKITDKCSNFKIHKMGKPTNLQSLATTSINDTNTTDNTPGQWWKYDMRITLSSTICPALHGSSRGKVDKVLLAEAIKRDLIHGLEECTQTKQNIYKFNNNAPFQSQSEIQINDISRHEKSNHIVVLLILKNLIMESKSTVHDTTKSSSSSSPDNNNHNNINNSEGNKIETVLTNFLQSIKEDDTLQHLYNFPQYSGLQPPYKLTIRTLPSSISGRDPKAHRLYAKYQAAIHNDPDPFSISRKEDSKMKDVSLKSESDDKDEESSYEDDFFPEENQATSEKLSIKEFETIYQRCDYDKSQIQKIYRR